MPRKGPAYPTSPEWKDAVSVAIRDMRDDDGRKFTRASFARYAKIKKNSLQDALADDGVQTPMMPDINRALGWRVPRVLCLPDELEIWAAVEELSDFERGRMLERARATAVKMREDAAASPKKPTKPR